MAPKPKGLQRAAKGAPGSRPQNMRAIARALLPKAAQPLVPIAEGQQAAAKLRAAHPTLDDETVALCVLHITTNATIAQIAEDIGADRSWCYIRIARPEVQRFLAELAMTVLGVEAARSIHTIRDLRDDTAQTPAMRFAAATELLDRAGLGNTTTQRAQGQSAAYAFTFAPAPKEPG